MELLADFSPPSMAMMYVPPDKELLVVVSAPLFTLGALAVFTQKVGLDFCLDKSHRSETDFGVDSLCDDTFVTSSVDLTAMPG